MPRETTEVLIVGAGPVGLALALELGLRDIDCLIIDRRDGRIDVPKMSVVSTSNMEFCRRWGIADDVRSAVWTRDRKLDFVYAENMLGRELARFAVPAYSQRGRDDYTPEIACHCPQIFFDPILAARAKKQTSVTFAYHTTLEDFTQDAEGVTARLRGDDGEIRSIRAKYLVGCDGAAGVVRGALDIALEGLGVVAESVNIYFRSPSFSTLHDKGWARIYRAIDDSGCWAELIPIDGRETWRLIVFNDPRAAREPDAYLKRMFGGAFPYETLDVSPWERRDYVARTFQRGRAFLAGDAAHQCSPTGGLGMATGVEEAVNLGWKMAAVLRGWGGPSLLDTFTPERLPIAKRNVDLSTRSYKAIETIPPWRHGSDPVAYAAELDGWRLNLARYSVPDHVKAQYTYEGSAICVADGTPADDPDPKTFTASSRPGARAPHAWLDDGRSTFDLFDEGFTLLRLGAEPPNASGLINAARDRGVPIHEAVVKEQRIADLYERPLVLVRPDRHVAWRAAAPPEDPMAAIDHIRGA